jgi:hypothetical protein
VQIDSQYELRCLSRLEVRLSIVPYEGSNHIKVGLSVKLLVLEHIRIHASNVSIEDVPSLEPVTFSECQLLVGIMHSVVDKLFTDMIELDWFAIVT